MRLGIAWLALAAVAGCSEQDEAETAVVALLENPASVKFQGVKDRGDFVCGSVNAKDERGAYRGYSRFIFDKSSNSAVLATPPPTEGLEASPAAGAACSKPQSYQTVGERLECGWGPETQADLERGRAFEAMWSKECT